MCYFPYLYGYDLEELTKDELNQLLKRFEAEKALAETRVEELGRVIQLLEDQKAKK